MLRRDIAIFILNYFKAHKMFSSGIVEDLNNKAKVTVKNSYGFHTFTTRRRPKTSERTISSNPARRLVQVPPARPPQSHSGGVYAYLSSARSRLGRNPSTTGRCLLAVIRKRRLLDVRREGRSCLAEFETEVVEVAFRRRIGAEFVDDRSEIGQRADRGQSRCIGWAHQAA